MTKIVLPFFNHGQPFEPKIYPDDIANLQNEEEALKAKSTAKLSDFWAAHQRFLALMLSRETTPPTAVAALTVPQIRLAMKRLADLLKEDPDRPLELAGGPSASSSSAA